MNIIDNCQKKTNLGVALAQRGELKYRIRHQSEALQIYIFRLRRIPANGLYGVILEHTKQTGNSGSKIGSLYPDSKIPEDIG